ncbi:uncharacterized protein VTP21DRAFT_4283 [Calcarisporiella thermophila]|uniref:uncharacterized protein n=1 Tax=Calcarisporiella thermophila TaxID=911321 RepID=UPI003742D497
MRNQRASWTISGPFLSSRPQLDHRSPSKLTSWRMRRFFASNQWGDSCTALEGASVKDMLQVVDSARDMWAVFALPQELLEC